MSVSVYSPITSTPGPSRKSVGSRNNLNLLRKTFSREEARNDDDAERYSLVASERRTSSTPASTGTNTDQSISLTPQKEHYQGCLKLYTEKKITKDNAWNLQLIDFMTTMMRRHDQRMENLQMASTVVDASAMIYSFRVDAVYHDVMFMAGGLTKVANSKRGKKDDDNAEEDSAPAPITKKKKRMKGATTSNPDLLDGDFETNLCIDPFFERLAATSGDVTSTNRVFNVTLPIHDTLALMLRTDIPFLEPIQENVSEALEAEERVTVPALLLPAWTDHDVVCQPITGFSITDWDPDSEQSELRPTRLEDTMNVDGLNLSQQAMAFDVNAEVEPIPADEPHNDLYEEEPLGGIESEEEGDVAVAACVARAAVPAPPRLTDMRPAGPRDARLEYSYCGVLSAWAGPSHWRLKHNRASKVCERTQWTGGGSADAHAQHKKPARTKRQLEFLSAGLAFDWRAPPSAEYEPALPPKIMISRKTLATGPAWNENNYRTPVDRGLDESFFRKLFLRRHMTLVRKREKAEGAEPEPEQLTVEEARDYDYNNENDASYCPLNIQEGEEWGNEEGTAAGDIHQQPQPAEPDDIGEMIEPPTKIAKIFIPYAMRAKKVDMKQLKHCSWKLLTEGSPAGGADHVAPTTFFSLYSRLPGKLTPEVGESLSIPLALLSVLHLANEKGLILEKRDDLKDVGILGLIR